MTPSKTEPFHFRMKQISEDTGHGRWIEAEQRQGSHSLISFRVTTTTGKMIPYDQRAQAKYRGQLSGLPVKRVAKLRVNDMLYRNRWLTVMYGDMVADRASDRLRRHLPADYKTPANGKKLRCPSSANTVPLHSQRN